MRKLIVTIAVLAIALPSEAARRRDGGAWWGIVWDWLTL